MRWRKRDGFSVDLYFRAHSAAHAQGLRYIRKPLQQLARLCGVRGADFLCADHHGSFPPAKKAAGRGAAISRVRVSGTTAAVYRAGTGDSVCTVVLQNRNRRVESGDRAVGAAGVLAVVAAEEK